MQFHDLRRDTPRKRSRQIGRGGKRGKTSGRGTKGQKARAGRKLRPEMRDVIKKIPKLRGYFMKSIKSKPAVISIGKIAAAFSQNDFVAPDSLFAKGLVRKKSGVIPKIKILSGGEIKISVSVSGCQISEEARKKILAAGGKISEK